MSALTKQELDWAVERAMDMGDELEAPPKNHKKEEKPLTAEDHLEAILFQFVNLYERWSEDRQVGAKQGAKIEKLIMSLADEVSSFRSAGKKVREDIGKRMTESGAAISNDLQECVRDQVRKTLVATIGGFTESLKGNASRVDKMMLDTVDYTRRQMESTVKDAGNALSNIHHAELERRNLITIGASVFLSIAVSVILGLLICWWEIPRLAVLPLSTEQMHSYQMGEALMTVWPLLGKRQQDELIDKMAKVGPGFLDVIGNKSMGKKSSESVKTD
jgi:hypothetical protein